MAQIQFSSICDRSCTFVLHQHAFLVVLSFTGPFFFLIANVVRGGRVGPRSCVAQPEASRGEAAEVGAAASQLSRSIVMPRLRANSRPQLFKTHRAASVAFVSLLRSASLISASVSAPVIIRFVTTTNVEGGKRAFGRRERPTLHLCPTSIRLPPPSLPSQSQSVSSFLHQSRSRAGLQPRLSNKL